MFKLIHRDANNGGQLR